MPQCSERALAIEELQIILATCIVSNSTEMIASFANSSRSSSTSSTLDGGDEGLDSVCTLYNCILSQR